MEPIPFNFLHDSEAVPYLRYSPHISDSLMLTKLNGSQKSKYRILNKKKDSDMNLLNNLKKDKNVQQLVM